MLFHCQRKQVSRHPCAQHFLLAQSKCCARRPNSVQENEVVIHNSFFSFKCHADQVPKIHWVQSHMALSEQLVLLLFCFLTNDHQHKEISVVQPLLCFWQHWVQRKWVSHKKNHGTFGRLAKVSNNKQSGNLVHL